MPEEGTEGHPVQVRRPLFVEAGLGGWGGVGGRGGLGLGDGG